MDITLQFEVPDDTEVTWSSDPHAQLKVMHNISTLIDKKQATMNGVSCSSCISEFMDAETLLEEIFEAVGGEDSSYVDEEEVIKTIKTKLLKYRGEKE